MNLIDRDKLIEELKKLKGDTTNRDYWVGCLRTMLQVIFCIEKQPTVNQWIPCKERLPKENEEVLVTLDDGDLEVVEFSYKYKSFSNGVRHGNGETYWIARNDVWYENNLYEQDVIAWQPLPKEYEEKENVD